MFCLSEFFGFLLLLLEWCLVNQHKFIFMVEGLQKLCLVVCTPESSAEEFLVYQIDFYFC